MRNVVITAGGTVEKIDKVRTINNSSTGSLGYVIANEFSKQEDVRVYYIYNSNIIPTGDNIIAIKINHIDELEQVVHELFANEKIDMFIHAMAVSDFKPVGYIEIEHYKDVLVKTMANKFLTETEVRTIVDTKMKEIVNPLGDKLSSKEDVAIIMERNKKIIAMIKNLSNETKLVGFKLLVDVEESVLLKVGYSMLKANDCDYVVANDLKNIEGNKHRAIVIDKNANYISLKTRYEIAEYLLQLL